MSRLKMANHLKGWDAKFLDYVLLRNKTAGLPGGKRYLFYVFLHGKH